MSRVAIVYFSQTDVTHQLAEEVQKGVVESGATGLTHRISGDEIINGRFVNQDLLQLISDCDGIIFGTPTYMGNVSAQLKSFLDATGELWSEQRWANKLAAGFTSGSAPNGDQGMTLQYLTLFAAQHGMLWMGLDSAHGFVNRGINRLGCQSGVVAVAENGKAHETDLASARYLGSRVAQFATQNNG